MHSSEPLVPRSGAPGSPARLRSLRANLEDLIRQSLSENTMKAYASDWRHFEDWCAEHGLDALPAQASTVALYLTDMTASYKPSTIKRRITSISKLHQMAGFTTPAHDPLVRSTWDGIRRVKGTMQEGKEPLLTDDVRAMIDVLDDDLRGLRDRALLLVGFAGCLRRSEVVGLDIPDLRFVSEGVVLLLRRSKTDQHGEGIKKGIPRGRTEHCPVRSLSAWIEAAQLDEGPVFRPIDRHGNIRPRRLTSHSVALVVKRACRKAGLDPDLYSGHSLRSGLATQAAISGVNEAAIVRQGAWATEKMARRYVRDGSLFRDNAAGQVGL